MYMSIKLVNSNFRRRSLFIVIITVFSLSYGMLFTSLNIHKYKSFFSFEWEDEAPDNQLICNTAYGHGDILHQTMFINKRFFGHFALIFFVISFFYKIYPSIYTWYFLMSFSYGFCALIVYLLARDILKDEKIAFIISLAYLFYSPLHYVNLGTLDSNTFSLPFLFLTLYFMHKRRFILYIISVVLSCMCKEDIPVIIFTLGLYQLFKKYPKKWWVSTLFLGGIYFLIAVFLLNTFFHMEGFESNVSANDFCYLDILTFKGIFSFIFFNTKEALRFIFMRPHLRVIFMMIYPLAFLPLLGIEMYIPFFMFGEIFISPGAYNSDSYYLAPIIPFLFMSLILFLKRVRLSFKNSAVVYISIIILLLCFLSNFDRNIIGYTALEHKRNAYDKRFLNVKNIFDPRIYTMDKEDRIAWKFIKMIPKNASVTASGDLLPALSCRRVLYEFGLNNRKAEESLYSLSEYPSYNVDFILIHTKYIANGLSGDYAHFSKRKDLEDEIRKLITHYHFFVFKKEGNFILLKKH